MQELLSQERKQKYNKLFLHPSFHNAISEISKLNITLPFNPSSEVMDFNLYNYPSEGKLITNIEEIKTYPLDPNRGISLLKNGLLISSYDESVNKFSGLEGTAFLTSHSLTILYQDEYIPVSYLTFYFYTRSKDYTENSEYIKYSTEPEADSKRDYVNDRNSFIVENVPENSIILIDGPLIGGQMSSYTYKLNKALLDKNVIPIFFVKNSSSNLVVDNVRELNRRYNSDIHWAFKVLKPGQRTNLFKYEDQTVRNNSKIFCYLKSFDISPQRIEFHADTFEKYKLNINEILDLIHYLSLVQGDYENPQVRTIAVAEKYARETLKLINLTSLMKKLGITSTMNQERFGWS